MLALRIADGALLGLIAQWLKAGLLEEDGQIVHPVTGTPQGGSVSPVLANVYWHYVLGLWFEHKGRKANQGQSYLIRYADDFVCGFAYRHQAQRLVGQRQERLKPFGLEVAPDQTRTLRFGRGGGPHNGRFDFLGFEFYWRLSRRGRPLTQRRTGRGYERLLRRFQRPHPCIVEKDPVPIRREPAEADVDAALNGLFRHDNHSRSSA